MLKQSTKRPVVLTRFSTIVIAAGVLTLFGTNGSLLRGHRALSEQVDDLREERQRSMIPSVGATMPALAGLTLDGDTVAVAFRDHRQTVLLVFSTTCPLCDANWPYWEALAEQIDEQRFRLVYSNLSDDLSKEYTRAHSFDAAEPIIAKVDPRSVVDYRLSLTPMLVLLDSDGTIISVWPGITRDDDKAEIEAAFGVSFEGVELAGLDG